MRYKVVKDFRDLMDNGHVYRAGDEFPRFGVDVDDERIAELSTRNNRRGEILIEAVEKADVGVAEEKDSAVESEVPSAKGKKRKKKDARADFGDAEELLHP